jgi:hypothetical protein
VAKRIPHQRDKEIQLKSEDLAVEDKVKVKVHAQPAQGAARKGAVSSKEPPRIVTGNITQGPCSNLQIGGSGNQQGISCESPAANLTFEAEDFKDLLNDGRKTMTVEIHTDRIVHDAIVWVLFSGPVKDTDFAALPWVSPPSSRHVLHATGAFNRDGTVSPNGVLIWFDNPSAFRPSDTLIFNLKTNASMRVLGVGVQAD